MASSFRMGRSGRGWIPAFAGMTGVRTPLTNTEQLQLWYRYDVTMGLRSLDMPSLALRGMSTDLHRELKSAAGRNHRSLNAEILARLTASVRDEPVDAGALLARIRLRWESIGQIDLREETLRTLRDAGRPSTPRVAHEPLCSPFPRPLR